MRLNEILSALEQLAPKSFQEGYDNSGLIVGSKEAEVNKVLFCLDSTEQVVDEAIEMGAELIVAHHPIVFSGLKSITGKNYIERTILKAIKNDIAI
ncbi:MAG: Nif3-like dinuclear metal center hexameric protein, partial [Vicingaceae bacterium]